MQTSALEFSHNTRAVYTAIRHLFDMKRTKFSSVKFNDDLLFVEARHGAWISPFSENVKIKVVATNTNACKVVVESSSRSFLNLLNFGANKGNVSDLGDYINNEVYKLCQPGEIPMTKQNDDHSAIRIVPPDIKFK
ncbi:MAG: hypothetical protein II834_00800 [Bacteroidaceae bacterium]|nr:hypothetical protein [Bacteroidaceae bacterium]